MRLRALGLTIGVAVLGLALPAWAVALTPEAGERRA